MDDALFDPGPSAPAPEPLSAGRKRTIRFRQLLDQGVHPVSGRPLRAGEFTCGDCANHMINVHAKTYHKCRLNNSGGPATDIRLSWPACTSFTQQEP